MNRAALRLIAVFLLIIGLACPASAQTTKTAWEKQIGTDCNNGSASADFDTLAQCSATSGSGTFQKAPLFVGQVTSPPYATTACDAAKAGMLQYTASSGFQGCNGSAWSSLASGSLVGYERLGTDCYNCSTLSLSCSSGKKILGCEFSQSTYAGAAQFTTDTTCSGNTIGGSLQYLAMQITCAYASTGTGTAGYLGSSAAATSPSRADDQTTGLFSATASTVSIATSGTERVRVTATGSVGIGTTSPNQLLEVFSSISDKGRIRISGTGTTADRYDGLEIFGKAGSATSFAGGLFREESTDRIAIWNSTGSILNISQSGNVGIVTTTPSERLDLGGGNIKMGWEIITKDCYNTNGCTALCSAEKQITGGGCYRINAGSVLDDSYPGSNGWNCFWENPPIQSRAVAICANIR